MAAESIHGSKAGEISEDEAQTRSDKLYNSIIEKMKSGHGCWEQFIPGIYKVPESLRKLKESAYTPRVVSIGPVHRHDERLKVMQDHKVRYMHSLFDRMIKLDETRKDDLPLDTLRDCGNAMLDSVSRARTYYAESFPVKCDDIKFAEMMLVDGCFILELLFGHCTRNHKATDPIYGNNLLRNYIRHDLLLLENQIPFFVLQQLFKLTLQKFQDVPRLSFTQLVLKCFGNMMNYERRVTDKAGPDEDHDHILGLLHKCYQIPQELGDFDPPVKHSATDLNRAGVSFKVSKGEDYLLVAFRTCCFTATIKSAVSKILPSWLSQSVGFLFDILSTCLCGTTKTISQIASSWMCCTCFVRSSAEGQPDVEDNKPNCPRSLSERNQRSLCNNCCCFFWLCQLCGGRSLEIPKLCIDDSTESFLRNLIAYEQCCPQIPRYITSYAMLMDTLVNSKEDVELLEKAHVLENDLGASEDASVLFNNLCKEVSLPQFYFANPWKQLDKYCVWWWPRILVSLRSTYFSNPWSFISLLAGLVLFALTITQTIYTVRSSN